MADENRKLFWEKDQLEKLPMESENFSYIRRKSEAGGNASLLQRVDAIGIIGRKRLTWMGHVIEEPNKWWPGLREEKGEGEAQEELAGDYPQRPARIESDVGRSYRSSGGQGMLEEMHRPMCNSARDGLRSKVENTNKLTCQVTALMKEAFKLLTAN